MFKQWTPRRIRVLFCLVKTGRPKMSSASMQSNSQGDMSARSLFVTAQDGLRLHVREYGSRTAPLLPVVCLPGLTRTVSDFDVLAPVLANSSAAGGPRRRVIAIDSRGRGQSEYDTNPENYNVAIELRDVVTILSALGIGRAVFVGSSRGGILTMLLAVAHPAVLAGAVLHDIGPVIEPAGLVRIKSYAGKLPQPRSFDEGAGILRRLFSAHFPKLTDADWLAAAQRTWKTADGSLVPTYDVRIAQTLSELDIDKPLPTMWAEFDALARVPVLVIRGANSDILSADTVAKMKEHDPGLQIIEVPDEGHVPSLVGEGLLQKIAAFVAACDAAANQPGVNTISAGSNPSMASQAPSEKARGQRW
jgi:pimeloyl-ACP methyl ester carboxylesterase